jgi:4-hydroxy-2-oxoheptanedioate aldolase
VEWGFDLVTVSSDARLLAGAAQASVKSLRELLGKTTPSDGKLAGGY